jgi:prepilin-type N-terminal cleavage/methylation domain-containing protein
MKINKTPSAFTLIELLVVMAIIAILASIALPVFSAVQERGKQTKDLSNGKQIVLALKQFALDNDGAFPSKVYVDVATAYSDALALPVAATDDSNDIFRWLIPAYTTSEDIFVVAGSTFSPNPADNIIDTPTTPSGASLVPGECGYAYVAGLNDTSNPQLPLVADAFNTVASPAAYTGDKSQPGGVWGGTKAIVIFVDGSGRVMVTDDKASVSPLTTIWRPGHSGTQDLFDTANGLAPADPWLQVAAPPENFILNPEPIP